MSLLHSQGIGVGLRTPITWNPNEKSAGVTLSSGNKVATSDATSSDQGTAAWLARATGKFYYELLLGATWVGGDTGIGALKQGASKPNFGSAGTLGLGLFPTGNMWHGSNYGNSGVSPAGTNSIGIALDLTNNLGWMTKDGSTWTFSGSPSGGTNGKAGGWTTGDSVVPAVCFNGNALVCTLRTRRVDFVFSIPSGFLAWEP